MQFTDLSLDKRLLTTIEHFGFEQPTAIQQQAIPVALNGHDLIASSKTGSGKTLAFLLPAMQRLMNNRALSKRDPRVVILTPTRELATQVFGQLRLLAANTQFKSVLILGGENFNDQANILAKNPHFIVATPGRLADHLEHRHLYLQGLELLILDEADRMLDLGFSEQLSKINQAADHRKRQTLLFSATLDHAQVNEFAAELLTKPKRVAIGHGHSEHEDINKRFYFCDNLEHKEKLLVYFLTTERYKQVIIFTATRSDTVRLAKLLNEKLAQQSVKCVALNGELAQSQRNQIMDGFIKGHQKILVTTDLASRGLDLLNVSHVINFDMPKHTEEFIHRIGRTGRAGSIGEAISLVGPKDWLSFKNVEGFLQQKIKFNIVTELKAKFNGIKKKKSAKSKATKEIKAKQKNKVNKPKQQIKQSVNFVDNAVGEQPIIRRKVKLAPQDIERNEQS